MKTFGGRYLQSEELRALGFRAVGGNVAIHSTCVLVGLEHMSLAGDIRIDAFCTIATSGGSIEVGRKEGGPGKPR